MECQPRGNAREKFVIPPDAANRVQRLHVHVAKSHVPTFLLLLPRCHARTEGHRLGSAFYL